MTRKIVKDSNGIELEALEGTGVPSGNPVMGQMDNQPSHSSFCHVSCYPAMEIMGRVNIGTNSYLEADFGAA